MVKKCDHISHTYLTLDETRHVKRLREGKGINHLNEWMKVEPTKNAL